MALSPYFAPTPDGDTAFTVEAPKIKFGAGSLGEVGDDARALGISVIVNSPAVFRFTGPACPERHLISAQAMGADTKGAGAEEGGDLLADRVIEMMRQTDMPNGLAGVGYGEDDVDALTDRAFVQKRLLDNAPCPVSRDQLKELFRAAMRYW